MKGGLPRSKVMHAIRAGVELTGRSDRVFEMVAPESLRTRERLIDPNAGL